MRVPCSARTRSNSMRNSSLTALVRLDVAEVGGAGEHAQGELMAAVDPLPGEILVAEQYHRARVAALGKRPEDLRGLDGVAALFRAFGASNQLRRARPFRRRCR